MLPADHLLIFGASVRAAAFSALRAGLQAWCADLFADTDLAARCPAIRLPGRYPGGFLGVSASAVSGPWMYTGALENHPALIARLSRMRPLWGNDSETLLRVRRPDFLAHLATLSGLPSPAIAAPGETPCGPRRWLIKPLRGAGGTGIRWWTPEAAAQVKVPTYLQEHIPGEPASAVYLGTRRGALLLGSTRQLIGADFLHASPFGYAGNIGPLSLSDSLTAALQTLGQHLAGAGLRGLFGVDGLLHEGSFWPVEVNPRYPASVEVLEHATGLRALHLHRLAFEEACAALACPLPGGKGEIVGKGVFYARAEVRFPLTGPWQKALTHPCSVEEMPDFADIPRPGDVIPAGRPILTLFAHAPSEAAGLALLKAKVAEVEHRLYP
jgi:predicted ATP-grasp superfamily ATP-dependent carboligase